MAARTAANGTKRATRTKRPGTDAYDELWSRYGDAPDVEARNALIEAYVPIVQREARKVAAALSHAVQAQELESAGTLGLIDSIRNFDPGQGLPMFGGEELRQFVDQAAWVTVNDYEWQLLKERTGWDVDEVKQRVRALIVTRGAEGSVIHTPDADLEIPAVTPAAVSDPTGCGDAYRAGLLYGIMAGFDWLTVGRVASLMGSIKIECHGTQNHEFTRDEFTSRFQASFGEPLTE